MLSAQLSVAANSNLKLRMHLTSSLRPSRFRAPGCVLPPLVACALALSAASARADEAGLLMPLRAEAGLAPLGYVAAGALLMLFAIALGWSHRSLSRRLDAVDHVLWGSLGLAGVGGIMLSLIRGLGDAQGLTQVALAISVPAVLLAWRSVSRALPGSGLFAAAACVAALTPAWMIFTSSFDTVPVPPVWFPGLGAALALALIALRLPFSIARDAHRATPGRGGGSPDVPVAVPIAPGSQHAASTVTPAAVRATRVMLTERIEQGIARARRADVPLALVWVDIHADDIDRLLGEEVTDRLLNTVAERLDRHLRVESMLARTGEYSFGAVCEAVTDIEEVLGIIAGLRDALVVPCDLGDGEIAIDASFGHAMFPFDGVDAAALSRVAARRAARTTKAVAPGRARAEGKAHLRKVS